MINWEEIRHEWESTKITLNALAEKHDIKLGTLKSRKSREGWSRDPTKKDATKSEKVASPKKKDATLKKNKEIKKETSVESDELTDKQWLFCMYYVKYFNAVKAYQRAYKCDYKSACSNAYRMMDNDGIRDEIGRMKKQVADGLMIDATAVLQKYIDIAFADITDFVTFGQKEQPEVNIMTGEPLLDEEGEQVMYSYSFVNLKNDDEVDGTIITEVKKGKDGVSVKLADKMRALDFLAKYTDLLSEKDRKKLQEEKLRVDIEKAKAEVDKLSSGDDGPIEILIKRKGERS